MRMALSLTVDFNESDVDRGFLNDDLEGSSEDEDEELKRYSGSISRVDNGDGANGGSGDCGRISTSLDEKQIFKTICFSSTNIKRAYLCVTNSILFFLMNVSR